MKSRLRVIVIAAATSVVVGIAAGFATAGDSGVGASRQATKLTPGSYKINTTMNTKLEVPRPKGATSGTGTFKATLKVVSATTLSVALNVPVPLVAPFGRGTSSFVFIVVLIL